MKNRILELISKYYSLNEVDALDLHTFKASGMKFENTHFDAPKFGSVSFMEAKGMMGLMKMTSCVINPFKKDAPLLSIDRINVMGKDLLIIELYDTLLNKNFSDKELVDLKNEYKEFTDGENKEHWYDSIKLKSSISKVGKKKDYEAFNNIILEYLDKYFELASKSNDCDELLKREKAKEYSEGLLKNGGPATDPVIKSLGREKTERFFRKVLFATDL